MRRIILCILVAAMCSASAKAQLTWWDSAKDPGGIEIGARFGLNLSKFTHVSRWSSILPGVNAGITVKKPVLNSLSVKSAFLFSMKGVTGKNPNGFGGSITTTFAPCYLEVPVLASYCLPVADDIKIHFDLGPYFGFGIGGPHTIKGEGFGAGETVRNGAFDFLKRFDMGLEFGPSFVWQNRYSVGLAFDTSIIDISDMGGKVGNFTCMINFGYRFKTF